jgi:hypothetical protein
MNLFRKRRNAAEPAENRFELATPVSHPKPAPPGQISLTAEQKDILQQEIDPRVNRILEQIYADQSAAERALNASRIVKFPSPDSGQRHVVQDANGFWRIVPGPSPKSETSLFDAI